MESEAKVYSSKRFISRRFPGILGVSQIGLLGLFSENFGSGYDPAFNDGALATLCIRAEYDMDFLKGKTDIDRSVWLEAHDRNNLDASRTLRLYQDIMDRRMRKLVGFPAGRNSRSRLGVRVIITPQLWKAAKMGDRESKRVLRAAVIRSS